MTSENSCIGSRRKSLGLSTTLGAGGNLKKCASDTFRPFETSDSGMDLKKRASDTGRPSKAVSADLKKFASGARLRKSFKKSSGLNRSSSSLSVTNDKFKNGIGHGMERMELHEAAATGDMDWIEVFLRKPKYSINLKDPIWQDKTALHWAAGKGFAEVVRLLLDYGAHGTARMSMNWTPAHCAAEAGKIGVLRALHASGVPIHRRDDYGDTPRRLAEIYGHVECVNFLKEAEEEIAQRRREQLQGDIGAGSSADEGEN